MTTERFPIWNLIDNWPIKVDRVFDDLGYPYTFLYKEGYWIKPPLLPVPDDLKECRERGIWVIVTGPKSCKLADVVHPEIQDVVEDICKDERFLDWELFKPFAKVTVEFNPTFFEEGSCYFLEASLYTLKKFTTDKLSFVSIINGNTLDITIPDLFNIKKPFSSRMYSIEQTFRSDDVYIRQNAVIYEKLNNVKRATLCESITTKSLVPENYINTPSVYLYKGKLCFPIEVGVEDCVLTLCTIPDRDFITVPNNKLKYLKLVCTYENKELCSHIDTATLKPMKTSVFLKFSNPHVFVYTDSKGHLDRLYLSENRKDCLSLKTIDNDIIKPDYVKSCYSLTSIKPVYSRLKHYEMIWDTILEMNFKEEM